MTLMTTDQVSAPLSDILLTGLLLINLWAVF